MEITKRRIFLIGIIILSIFFFPKPLHACWGDGLCSGLIGHESKTWLNVKDSTFERRVGHPVCFGLYIPITMVYDGCPGNWGWYNAMPVDCNQVKSCFEKCSSELEPEGLYCDIYCEKYSDICKSLSVIMGVECSEWRRVCEEIKSADTVDIVIKNITETRVILTDD